MDEHTMNLFPISTSWALASDTLVDFFILQWRTPLLEERGACKSIDTNLAKERENFLREFHSWLVPNFDKKKPVRPLFIIAPELSLPIACEQAVNDLVSNLNRPTVFIVGYEFLVWKQYLELIEASDLPEKEKWCKGGNEGGFVNAAGIWISDGKGNKKKYLQTKSSPSRPEHAAVFSGTSYLLFLTENQANGKRLNFSVQICSDFTSDEKVKSFRKNLGSTQPPHNLDITILLQCNPDQNAIQFRSAIKTYFLPPVEGMIDTTKGCIVLVNNSNEAHGLSTEWGQSKLGVQFTQGWKAPIQSPQASYLVRNQPDFEHQEIIFRESGPGIYQFTYKPRYLVTTIPGSDDFPFHEGNVLYAKINGDSFGQSPCQPFIDLPASIYWFNAHWSKTQIALAEQKKDPEPKQMIIDLLLKVYNQIQSEWIKKIDSREAMLHEAINAYFLCFIDMPRFPFNPPEPSEWNEESCIGICKLLENYALVFFGSNSELKLEISKLQHALLEDVIVVFIFARNQKSVRGIFQKFRSEIAAFTKSYLDRKYLIILIDPDSQPPKREIIEEIESEESITIGTHVKEVGHLAQKGSVVSGQPRNKFGILYSGELLGQLEISGDEKALKNSLNKMIYGQFE